MGLITDINAILTQLYPDATHFLSSKFRANINSFNAAASAFPLIIIDNEITKDNEIKANANVMKSTGIVISFYNLDDMDNTDTQSNAIVEAMEVYADRTAAQIYQLLPVRPDTRQTYRVTPDFHAYSTNLTGAILDMTVNYNSIVNFAMPEA